VKAPHKPWTDAAQDLFMATAPGYLQLAKLLLHFSAQRGGDCVKMKWTDFDGAGLFVMPEKNSTGADLEPNYHLCPKPLLDALLERQAQGNLADTILTNFYGRPWATSESLSLSIRDHLIKIRLAKRGTKTISMHGLERTRPARSAAFCLVPLASRASPARSQMRWLTTIPSTPTRSRSTSRSSSAGMKRLQRGPASVLRSDELRYGL